MAVAATSVAATRSDTAQTTNKTDAVEKSGLCERMGDSSTSGKSLR